MGIPRTCFSSPAPIGGATPAGYDAFLSMRVKIVLREKQSGLYYQGDGQWASNGYEALTFNNILEAEQFCRARRLEGLQLIQQSGYFHRPVRYARQKGGTAPGSSGALALLFACVCYC